MAYSRPTGNPTMKKTILMIAVTCLPVTIPAQTVSGLVQIGTNPVAGARVTLFNADTSDFREIRSAGDGSFSFSPVSGAYRLGVAFLGRQYQELNVAGGQTGIAATLAPETQPGRWDIILSSAPELLGGTNSAVLMPDGRIIYCHNTL